ncbi:MarR family winged helix-turn-helix transcriptional regulator [Pollutimonas thiosulfatoxidans]|nr:MarR family transcriptional regulator [Pollutimonas thiosulfatoxidans]
MSDFLELQAIQQLGRTYRSLMSAFEAELGHSMARWRILLTLHQSGELSQKQLARTLFMDPAALTRQIKTIETQGWITRRSDADDNRLTNVALTPAGQDLVTQCMPRRTAFIKNAFVDLSAAEIKALEAMLHTVDQRLKRMP